MQNSESVLRALREEYENASEKESSNLAVKNYETFLGLLEKQEAELTALKTALETSELFFSLPEVTLVNSNKLPRVIIEAGDVVPMGDNFYEAEPYGSGHIRWTGPGRLNNFSVPIDRNTVRTLRLSIARAITPKLLTSIKIYIDNDLVEYDIEARGDGTELIATLPESTRVQDTLVSIFVPQLFAPSELDSASTDDRKLGFAFHKLEVV